MLNRVFGALAWLAAALTFALSIALPSGYGIGTTFIFFIVLVGVVCTESQMV